MPTWIFFIFVFALLFGNFLAGGNAATFMLMCLMFTLCQSDASIDMDDIEKRLQDIEKMKHESNLES